MLTPTGIITPVRVNELKRMLLYVVCTAGEFVWNEGGDVPATCYLCLISQCVIFFTVSCANILSFFFSMIVVIVFPVLALQA